MSLSDSFFFSGISFIKGDDKDEFNIEERKREI
jgi:hypothetical protein